MTDHQKVRGCGSTQLGSLANTSGFRMGSTAGYDLCHDLTSSKETEVTFLTKIMGRAIPPPATLLLTPGHDPVWLKLQDAE